MNENIFETAARHKVRFATSKGEITVEDLFDLPLTSTLNRVNLNDIGVGIIKLLKETEDISLVASAKKSAATTLLQLKLEIVKRVIEIKLEEAEARKLAADKAEQRQELMALLAEKDAEALKGLSREEIQRRLEELSK